MKDKKLTYVSHLPAQTTAYVPPPPTPHERKMQGMRFAPVTLPRVNMGTIVPDEIDHGFARGLRPADAEKENA